MTSPRTAALALTLWLAVAPAASGTIGLAWDGVDGATGYRIYYGTTAGLYTQHVDVGNTTTADLDGLDDCRDYFVSVKAYNSQGESADYSEEIAGWARPYLSPNATAVKQGDQVVLTLPGGGFADGTEVWVAGTVPEDGYGMPLVQLGSVEVDSCGTIQALLTVEPTVEDLQAMPLGDLDLELDVVNPDGVFNRGVAVIQVEFDQDRADINQESERTLNRIDGDDLASLVRVWGTTPGVGEFEYRYDLDGDQDIDGEDLALLASIFGRCRDTDAWTVDACF